MKASSSIVSMSSLVMAVGAVFASGDAGAALVERRLIQNAAGVCQPFKNADGLQLRNRPRTIQNDGTAPITVTCAFTTQGNWSVNDVSNPTGLSVYASANDGVADTISCTLVPGYNYGPTAAIVKSVDVGSLDTGMFWEPEDLQAVGTLPSGLISVSCVLNPGVGLNDTYVYYLEDNGV